MQCCEKNFRNQYVLSHHLFVAHDGYFNICFETVFRSTDISICNTKFNCCRRREHNDDHMYCHGEIHNQHSSGSKFLILVTQLVTMLYLPFAMHRKATKDHMYADLAIYLAHIMPLLLQMCNVSE